MGDFNGGVFSFQDGDLPTIVPLTGAKSKTRDRLKGADEISVAGHFPEPSLFGWAPKDDVGARTHDLTLPK
ncbi:hypothetical protein TorRG33x02_273050 [Trema orientale]|uniref:Uncharacterized protein n=1 Tax=Trema orientale TaxID=63057 RepID=A0A2P5CU32_TREOI|nr:hypothetical protein TorRG33x02_273050 [Trema orientale]